MHKHHFILEEKIIDGWTLARCKWCSKIDAYRCYYDTKLHGSSASVPTLADKRAFMRSQGLAVPPSFWDKEEKTAVIKSVTKIGVTSTARKFGIPTSTVGLWAKGLSPKSFKGYKYTIEFKKKVAAYAELTNNNRRTAKLFDITRGSVQKWRKEYMSPVSI